MRKRLLLIIALSFGTPLVGVLFLASSYLALSTAIDALPKRLSHARPATPLAEPPQMQAKVEARAATGVEADRLPPAPLSPETDGELALRAAMERDPDIAALVDDSDPQISGAIRAFFADDAEP